VIGFDWSQLDFLIWQCRMLYSAQQWLYSYRLHRNSGVRVTWLLSASQCVCQQHLVSDCSWYQQSSFSCY